MKHLHIYNNPQTQRNKCTHTVHSNVNKQDLKIYNSHMLFPGYILWSTGLMVPPNSFTTAFIYFLGKQNQLYNRVYQGCVKSTPLSRGKSGTWTYDLVLFLTLKRDKKIIVQAEPLTSCSKNPCCSLTSIN